MRYVPKSNKLKNNQKKTLCLLLKNNSFSKVLHPNNLNISVLNIPISIFFLLHHPDKSKKE